MKQFPIKSLRGIETKTVATNQDRGALRKAEGLMVVPKDALSTAPTWAVAWGCTNIVSAMATALSGATAGKVHFVTVQDSVGNVFLCAWDLSTTSARGVWCVASGAAAPTFSSASGVSITATNDATHRDYTAGLNWYGMWVENGRMILGNGTDNNLVWHINGLYPGLHVLGWTIGNTYTNLLQWSEDFTKSVWTMNTVTATANQAANPMNGDLTADLLTPTSADSSLSQDATPLAVTPHTFSVWLRTLTGTITIDLLSLREAGGGVTVTAITITTAWQRFSHTFTPADLTAYRAQIGAASTWATGQPIYAWGAEVSAGSTADIYVKTEGGPVTVTYPQATSPSQYRFPACTSFAQMPNGVILASGNVNHPLRVYASDPPTVQYPSPSGLLTDDRSFADLNRFSPAATRITALSPVGSGFIAHLGLGGAVWVGNWDRANDGNLLAQLPLENCAGAVNPACCANADFGLSYFGSDLEIYAAKASRAPATNTLEPRDQQIETSKSSGQWNRDMTRGTGITYQPFVLDDVVNNRLFVSAQATLKSQPALFVYDRLTHSVTGPHRYPSLTCATPLLNQNLPGTVQALGNGGAYVVVGFSIGGSLMFADLGLTGELTLPTPGTAIGAAYSIVASQPTPTKGLCCIGIYGTNLDQFVMVSSDGKVSTMATPWSEWVDAGTTVPTVTTWLNDAALCVVDLSQEDFGSPVLQKDFMSVRIQWRAMQRAYCGVAVQSNSVRDYRFAGTSYPYEENYVPITTKGTRLSVRLLIVSFNGSPSCLPDVTIGYDQGTPA